MKIMLSSMLCLAILLAGCCINFGCVMLGKYERTVQLSAPLSPGSTFDAKTHNGSITIHGDFASLEIDGKKIAINHYPEIARREAESGKYDLVCYGHDHTAHNEMIGKTLLLNPGELMGMNGRSTLAIYDTQSEEIEWIELNG